MKARTCPRLKTYSRYIWSERNEIDMIYRLNWIASNGSTKTVDFTEEKLAAEAYKLLKLATTAWFTI